jgi:uncharacterized protein YbjT (DUF2867 family)
MEPMSTILVTGGTGGLGRPTVRKLVVAGHDVRVFSRRPGDGRLVGDLSTGAGLPAALDGVDTVVHLATNRRKDAPATSTLLERSGAAGVRHFVFISIVGVDDIPYFYYRDKVEIERMIEASGIPFTILRATQFHDFVAGFLRPQRRLPFLVSLDLPVQPIAVEEVATRLVELAADRPMGRVADIGGPEARQLPEFIADWQRAFGTTKKVRTLPLGGKTIRAFRAGHHLTPLPGYGRETFAEFAVRQAAMAAFR